MAKRGESVASSLLRRFIITSESPSRIKDEKPSSSAKEMARAAARLRRYPMCVGEEPAQIWMLEPVQMSFESQHLDLPSGYP